MYYKFFNYSFHKEPSFEVTVIHLYTYNLPTHNIFFIIITIIHSCALLFIHCTLSTHKLHTISINAQSTSTELVS